MIKYYYNRYQAIAKTYGDISTHIGRLDIPLESTINYVYYGEYYLIPDINLNTINKYFTFREASTNIKLLTTNANSSGRKSSTTVPFLINSTFTKDPNTLYDSYYSDTYYISNNRFACDSTTAYVYDVTKHEVGITEYQPGSLVESNIVAKDGLYPDNGMASDGYWYIKGEQWHNTAPTLSPESYDMGIKNRPFSITYKSDDVNVGNRLSSTIKIDENIVYNDSNVRGSKTYSLSNDIWASLSEGSHILTITIDDGQTEFNTVTNRYTFEKRTMIEIKNKPIETLDCIKNIQIRINSTGLTNKVYVTNNAFDVDPVWEEIKDLSKTHIFSNKTKTSDKWGICVKIISHIN